MQAGFSVSKPSANENYIENQEQPSPISVLEPSFDENDHAIPEFYNNLKPVGNGKKLIALNTVEDPCTLFSDCMFVYFSYFH